MNRTMTVIAWIFFIVLAFSLIRWMDGVYDRADLKNAQRVIVSARPGGQDAPLLLELMAQDAGCTVAEVACAYQIKSASEGSVRAQCHCHVPEKNIQAEQKIFEWLVHRLNGKVIAISEAALTLEKKWEEKPDDEEKK